MHRTLLQVVLVLFVLQLRPEPLIRAAPDSTPVVDAGTSTGETLFETTLTADSLPVGPAEGALWRRALDLGAGEGWSEGPLPPRSVELVYVAAGSVVVSAEGPTSVLNAAAAEGEARFWQAVPPNTEVTLQSDASIVFAEGAGHRAWRAAGSEPIVLLGATIVALVGSATLDGPAVSGTWEVLAALAPSDWARLPAGPLSVALRRVKVPVGADVPLPPGALELLFVEAGVLEASSGPSTTAGTPSPPLIVSAGSSVPFAVPPAGGTLAIRNAGDRPLVALALTFTPAGPGGLPLSTGTPAP